MPIVDDRGRVFGRVNLADAALLLFLAVLIPAAYGAFLLFREPVPTLSLVTPHVLQEGPGLQVEIRGAHFRPYMRVSFDDQQGLAFWFVNADMAVVPLPALKPGQYDVVLYDYMREVARLPKALTVEPALAPPTVQLEMSGVITSLTADQVRLIAPGHQFRDGSGPIAEVLSVGQPEPDVIRITVGDRSTITVPVRDRLQLPARVRTSCLVQPSPDGTLRCTVGGVVLARDVNIRYPGLQTGVTFHVNEIGAASAPAK